jgi:hypothetical protein
MIFHCFVFGEVRFEVPNVIKQMIVIHRNRAMPYEYAMDGASRPLDFAGNAGFTMVVVDVSTLAVSRKIQ